MDNTILDRYSHLPANKLKAVHLIATKGLEHNLTMDEIATECGVTRKTLWVWKGEKEFNDALNTLAKELNRSAIPKILSRLTREIDSASARDITNIARLLMQYHGELTEKSEVTVKEGHNDIDSILKELEDL